MASVAKFPALIWAQRADRVLITVNVADCENIEIDVTDEGNKLLFKATANGEKYEINMELFKTCVKDESKWNTKGRNVLMSISKKDKEDEEWWPRLHKDKAKNQQIGADWAKWADPDDEEEE